MRLVDNYVDGLKRFVMHDTNIPLPAGGVQLSYTLYTLSSVCLQTRDI